MSLSPVPNKGICAAKGFSAAGVAAGIKKSGRLDLALILSDALASVAAAFTTNKGASPTVAVNRERIASGTARGVVVNSGCANSFTGKRGYEDAVAMAEEAARAAGVGPSEMLVCSTGLIGSFLPMDAVRSGIAAAAKALAHDDETTMKAIMTTDTRPKMAAVSSSDGWSIGGICKGAAMIAPNMATMLAFVTSDAIVDPPALQAALSGAVEYSFNRITIDGDRSTNDTVLCFANGASGVTPDAEAFASALTAVCRSLAEQIVADGEGATKFVRVRVRGAVDEPDALLAARAVAESLLVKTALFGNDPNWGRIAAAIGYSGAVADLGKLSISIAGHDLFSEGSPCTEEALDRAASALRASSDVTIVCDLYAGDASAEILTADLSSEYVRLNAEYST